MCDRRQENGIKRTRRRNFIIAAVEVLGIASVFAVGFSAWVFSGGDGFFASVSTNANFAIAEIIDLSQVISFDTSFGTGGLQCFSYDSNSFVENGTHVQIGYIRAKFSLNLIPLRKWLSNGSYSLSSSANLKLSLLANRASQSTFALFSNCLKRSADGSASFARFYNPTYGFDELRGSKFSVPSFNRIDYIADIGEYTYAIDELDVLVTFEFDLGLASSDFDWQNNAYVDLIRSSFSFSLGADFEVL